MTPVSAAVSDAAADRQEVRAGGQRRLCVRRGLYCTCPVTPPGAVPAVTSPQPGHSVTLETVTNLRSFQQRHQHRRQTIRSATYASFSESRTLAIDGPVAGLAEALSDTRMAADNRVALVALGFMGLGLVQLIRDRAPAFRAQY